MTTNYQFPVVANVAPDNQDTSLFEKSTFVHANTECPICLEPIVKPKINSGGSPFAKNITALNCHHAMCTSCFVSYIQSNHNCPICRTPMFTMDVEYSQQMFVVPVATSLGQRLQQQLTPQESRTLLRTSRTTALRDAAPLSATRAERSATRAELGSTRRASRSPIRYYRRSREISDYYDEDYDIDMTVQTDAPNIYRGAGRAAGIMLFIIADIAIMVGWLISLWITK
jgi:hypothetical protein